MGLNFSISEQNLRTVLSGDSAIDFLRLEISNLESANQFIQSYGFNSSKSEDVEELWGIHRKSVSILREHLLEDGEKIPDELGDPSLLGEIGNLLVMASQKEDSENQRWACAILKVMHAYAHVKNDLFSQFSDEIQEQILKRFKSHIVENPAFGVKLGSGEESISLHKFEVKPFKRSSSSVIKLLSKKNAVAINLLDRLGIRIVTKNIFDSFRVIDYLLKENIVSFPNVMPEQSHNNVYPLNILLEVVRSQPAENINTENINQILHEKLIAEEDRAEFKVKENAFSSAEYKFMKFISRQLIEVEWGGRVIHFFFPYEVQVLDYDTFIGNLSGPQAHDEYKKRQKAAARLRVFGK
jgi:uncharacterized protein (TIGR04562 family)